MYQEHISYLNFKVFLSSDLHKLKSKEFSRHPWYQFYNVTAKLPSWVENV